MKVNLPHIHEYRDQHGKLKRYLRRPGFQKVRLRAEPGTPEFIAEYHEATQGATPTPKPVSVRAGEPGTVTAAIADYYRSKLYLSLAPGTRAMRRAVLERFRAKDGHRMIAEMRTADVSKRLAGLGPWAERNWLKSLRGLMKFAIASGLRKDDPTKLIEPTKATAGTFHTWTEEEIEIFEAMYPVGSTPRLAMALMLYTAARRSDAVLLGYQHMRAGRLVYRQQKTKRDMDIPVHPTLAAIIEATPSGNLTFLVTRYGRPFSANGMGNAMRKWCNKAALPDCTSHGLRKAQARRLAEAGCTPHEIAAITGHKTLAEVQRYTDAANRARLADAAVSRTELAHRTAHVIGSPSNTRKSNA